MLLVGKSTIIIGIYHYIIYIYITMVNQLFRLGHFNHSKLLKWISGWWLSPTPLKNDGLSSSVGIITA